MKEAKAFAPANVSCIFSLYGDDGAEKKGSLGVGFTLDKGVTATARKGDIGRIIVNGKEMGFDTVSGVVNELTDSKIEVRIESELPFGCGFGLSGASALATAYAVDELLSLGKENKELAMIAHVSEVENATGRGDVGGQFNGGFMMKVEKDRPLEVKRLNIKQRDIFYKVYGPIETKRVINNKEAVERINEAGNVALHEVMKLKNVSFEEIADISKRFAFESGLLQSKRVIDDINEIEKMGGKASMIMLGEAVFSNMPLDGYDKAMISNKGARLL